MASIYTGKQAPIRGPYVKQAFAKSIYKGEDAWLQQRDVQVPASGGVFWPICAPVSLSGANISNHCMLLMHAAKS